MSNKETPLPLSNSELIIISTVIFVLIYVLLEVAGQLGYDLFTDQLGASLLLYLTTYSTFISIIRRRVEVSKFLFIFLIFSIFTFTFTAMTKPMGDPFILDNFETGTAGWYCTVAQDVTYKIIEESRQSPEGEWHLKWFIHARENASENWAVLENCIPSSLNIVDYNEITFWYKTGRDDKSFIIEIRATDVNNSYWYALDPSIKWNEVSFNLPPRIYPVKWEKRGSPIDENAHFSFSIDNNNEIYIDNIVLKQVTFYERNGLNLILLVNLLLSICAIGIIWLKSKSRIE